MNGGNKQTPLLDRPDANILSQLKAITSGPHINHGTVLYRHQFFFLQMVSVI